MKENNNNNNNNNNDNNILKKNSNSTTQRHQLSQCGKLFVSFSRIENNENPNMKTLHSFLLSTFSWKPNRAKSPTPSIFANTN
jgi:hypothetical protein